jgi:hypothetical protein
VGLAGSRAAQGRGKGEEALAGAESKVVQRRPGDRRSNKGFSCENCRKFQAVAPAVPFFFLNLGNSKSYWDGKYKFLGKPTLARATVFKKRIYNALYYKTVIKTISNGFYTITVINL